MDGGLVGPFANLRAGAEVLTHGTIDHYQVSLEQICVRQQRQDRGHEAGHRLRPLTQIHDGGGRWYFAREDEFAVVTVKGQQS